jgi:hypothetical protein
LSSLTRNNKYEIKRHCHWETTSSRSLARQKHYAIGLQRHQVFMNLSSLTSIGKCDIGRQRH